MMKNKKFVYLGFIIPIVFWITIIFCGLMTENYNHLANMVSELGAIGTKTEYIFNISLILISLLSILFIVGISKIAKANNLNIIPIMLILTFSFSILGAAIFPLPLSLHGILGSPSMILPLSPLLAIILWKENKIPNLKIASGIIFIIMILGFLTLIPSILENYFGLKQRFFHLGWSLWFIYLSQKFLKLDNNLLDKNK